MSGHCLTWIVQNSNPTSQFLCAALLNIVLWKFDGYSTSVYASKAMSPNKNTAELGWASGLPQVVSMLCESIWASKTMAWFPSISVSLLSLYCLSRLSISVNYSTSDLSSRVELSRLRIGDLDREREREREREGLIIQRCTVNPFKRYTQAGKRLQQNLSLDGNCLSSRSLSKQFIKKFIKLFQALAGQPRPSTSSRGSLSLSIFDLWNLGRSKSKESKVRSSVPHRMPFVPMLRWHTCQTDPKIEVLNFVKGQAFKCVASRSL